MGLLVIGHPARALLRVTQNCSEERLARDGWRKCRLEVQILLCFFIDEDINVMCAFRVEWLCPFCSQTRPVVVMTTLQLGILEAASAAGRSNSVLAVLASTSSRPTGLMFFPKASPMLGFSFSR